MDVCDQMPKADCHSALQQIPSRFKHIRDLPADRRPRPMIEHHLFMSQQSLLLGLINGGNAWAKAQASSKRTIDLQVPGVCKRLGAWVHPGTQ